MDLLREMVEIQSSKQEDINLAEELNGLMTRYEACLEAAQTLVENDTSVMDDDVMAMMDEVSKRFAAAKRGLSLVNRLQPGPSKAKNTSRIMGNMNRIRGMLRRLEKKLSLDT